MKKLIVSVIIIGMWIWFTFAHQPRLIFQQPAGQVVNIQNPEVSQAFYGNLVGQEDKYQIVSNTGFLLDVSLTVPDISWSRTDFVLEVRDQHNIIISTVDGKTVPWSKFFEPFAGDNYLSSLWWAMNAWSGVYNIIVHNPDNQWKYALVVGTIESFPAKEIINTFKVMPALKMQFFEKPRYTIFWNYVWLFLLVMIIVVVVVVWWGVKLVKYIRRR